MIFKKVTILIHGFCYNVAQRTITMIKNCAKNRCNINIVFLITFSFDLNLNT